MLTVLLGAMLPIVVTLLLGFFAAWHHDFTGDQASVLNRMVMRYALPLSLFTGLVVTKRSEILSDVPMSLAVAVSMVGAYGIAFAVAFWVFRQKIGVAALIGLAIGGPAVPFVGSSVLGYLFGSVSAVPIAVAGIVMNLIQVPLTIILLEHGTGGVKERPADAPPRSLWASIVSAIKEPVVWAPFAALVLVLVGVALPKPVTQALALLGSTTGGVALFASGVVLFAHKVAVNWSVAIVVIARNVIVPGILLLLLGLIGLNAAGIQQSVITMAIPTASVAVILAVQYKTAEKLMASTLFWSTILSVGTMAVFIALTGVGQ